MRTNSNPIQSNCEPVNYGVNSFWVRCMGSILYAYCNKLMWDWLDVRPGKTGRLLAILGLHLSSTKQRRRNKNPTSQPSMTSSSTSTIRPCERTTCVTTFQKRPQSRLIQMKKSDWTIAASILDRFENIMILFHEKK